MDYKDHSDEIIAWICCTKPLSQWTVKPATTFYRVILRTNKHVAEPSIYISTSNTNGEYREAKVFYKDRDEVNLRNILHTIFGRRESARTIITLTQCRYVDIKKSMRESVIEGMRFIEKPFDISYVDCGSICHGTIIDIVWDSTNRTNKFVIAPDGEPTARIYKMSGEVNVPFQNWRKE